MSDDSPESLGDDPTYVGKRKDREDQSLGDQSTYAGSNESSLSDLGGIGDDLGDSLAGLEIVDLESRYTIIRPIGKGGMGEVFLATDTRLNRKVAIKRIKDELTTPAAAARFLTEAKSIAALSHPYIVQVYDYGRAKDGPFLTMEYVEGENLQQVCSKGVMALEDAIDLSCKLCDALSAAHSLGIIHRDIKPANIFMTSGGWPKILDFGLAKAKATGTGVTRAGVVLGTPSFMPQEQHRDASLVDERSDIWSLAATLYQMLTGKSPRIIKFNEVPKSLHDVLGKALEDEKDDRYQTAADFKSALQDCLGRGTNSASPTDPLTGVTLGAGVCLKCRTKNDSNRKFCSQCAGSLRVRCLKCDQEIPVWDEVCGECGGKQAELVKVCRAKMSLRQSRAKELLNEYNYKEAELVAKELRDEPDSRLQQYKEWAEMFLQGLVRDREQQQTRTKELVEEALIYEKALEYEAGIDSLKRVPNSLRDLLIPNHTYTISVLLKRLQKSLREKQRLEQLEAQRDKAFTAAEHLFELQAYHDCLAKLALIDSSVLTDEIISLRQQAESNRIRLEELSFLIGETVELDNFGDPFLLGLVDEYLELCSKDEDMVDLRDRLIDRQRKEALRAKIDEEIQSKIEAQEYDGLLTELNRLEELGPLATDYPQLREWLNSWELLSSELRSAASAFRVAPFLNFGSGDEDSSFLSNRLERSIKAEELWRKSSLSDSDDRSLEVVERILQLDPKHPEAKVIIKPLRYQWFERRNWSVCKFKGHRHQIIRLKFIANGRKILSQDQGGATREWILQAKREVKASRKGLFRATCGKYSFSGLGTNEILVWDTGSGEEIGRLKASSGCFIYLTFSPNRRQVLTVNEDSTLCIWELNSLQQLQSFSDTGFKPSTAIFSPRGDLLIAAGLTGIRVWSVKSGEQLFRHDGVFSERFLISSSPDQRYLYWLERNGCVAVADIYEPRQFRHFGNDVRTFCFSPDGKYVATGNVDNVVTTWSTEGLQQIKNLYGHRYAVNCVAFSPDGTRIASGSEDETVRLWDVNSGQEIRIFEGHLSSIWQRLSGKCGYITALTFSPDGTYLATGSSDKTVQVWYAEF